MHEILSRKWVYYGEYLNHYPNIYYQVSDRLSYQDFCNMQILLCLDNLDASPKEGKMPHKKLTPFKQVLSTISHFSQD